MPATQAEQKLIRPDLATLVEAACDSPEQAEPKRLLSCDTDAKMTVLKAWAARMRTPEWSGLPSRALEPLPNGRPVCEAAREIAESVVERLHDRTEKLLYACNEHKNRKRLVAVLCRRLAQDDLKSSDGAKALLVNLECDKEDNARNVERPKGKPLCVQVLGTEGADQVRDLPEYDALHEYCDPESNRAAVPVVMAAFIAPLLQGTGDFLKDRAKEELLAFAVEKVGRGFCAAGDDLDEEDLVALVNREASLGVRHKDREDLKDAYDLGTNKPRSAWGFKDDKNVVKLRGAHWSDPILASRSAQTMSYGVAAGYWALDLDDRQTARAIRGKVPLNGSVIFPETCATFLPDGVDGAADVDAIHSGEMQRVLTGELMTLPIRLLSLDGLPLSAATPTGNEEKQLRLMAHELAKAIQRAVQRKTPALDFLAGLDPSVRKALGDEGVMPASCKLEHGKAPSMSCTLGLIFTTVSKSKEMLQGVEDGTIPPEALAWVWTEAAAKEFCKNYGGANGDSDQCITTGARESHLAVWRGLEATVRAVVDFHDALGTIQWQYKEALKTKPPIVAAAEAAESAAAAVDTLTGAIVTLGGVIADAVKENPNGARDTTRALAAFAKMKQVTGFVRAALKGAAAATRQDYRAVAASVKIVLNHELVAPHLPDDEGFKKSLAFVLALGEAKTREDVREVLDEYAAPAGSYRAKYVGANRWFLNGFVGAGVSVNVWTPWTEARGTAEQAPARVAATPLTAPIGIDYTAWHGTHNHVGFTLTALDPLALRIIQREGEDTEYDFGGVLTPGLFFRWGMFRSPVALMVGARWQPYLKSVAQDCGSSGDKTCWQGPLTVMGSLAVDVPIFPLD